MATAPTGAAVTALQGGGSSSYGNAGLGTADAGPVGARLLEVAEAGATVAQGTGGGVGREEGEQTAGLTVMVAQAGRGKKK